MLQTLMLVFCAVLFHHSDNVNGAVLQADEDIAVQRIFDLIQNLTDEGNIRNPAAKLVRLSFHDCVGGCDGCVNLNNIDNNGLQDIYSQINDIYNNERYDGKGMSRADFIALAGTVAVRQASLRQMCDRLSLPPGCELPTPEIVIKYGRTDCATSPYTTAANEFPNPHGDLAHVLDFFQGQMNMTVRQIVAILGAHTLGDAGVARSGFRGPWVPQTTVFDNMFYRQLRNPNNNWFQEAVSDAKSPVYPELRYQWTLTRENLPDQLMLNTDVAIWKFVHPAANGQEENETCRANINNCAPSETANIVTEFADDNNAFHEAFGSAFQILVENGYDSDLLTTAVKEQSPTNSTSAVRATPTVTLLGLFVAMAMIVFLHLM